VDGAMQADNLGLQLLGFREESRDHGRSLAFLALRGKLASPSRYHLRDAFPDAARAPRDQSSFADKR
jgi:hypothetical protein